MKLPSRLSECRIFPCICFASQLIFPQQFGSNFPREAIVQSTERVPRPASFSPLPPRPLVDCGVVLRLRRCGAGWSPLLFRVATATPRAKPGNVFVRMP